MLGVRLGVPEGVGERLAVILGVRLGVPEGVGERLPVIVDV